MRFKPEANDPIRDAVVELIDKAMQKKNSDQPRRQYLGASRIGEECSRRLAYEYHMTPKDEDAGFKGNTLRIFDMGHDGEERMAEYIKLAGFELQTHTADGRQIAISDADGKFKGHLDGVIHGGPAIAGLKYPCLWENKALGDKSWKDAVKNGIKEAKKVYYAQVQVYMGYHGLDSCMFTCLNRDTGEIHVEIIPFDSRDCQDYVDKVVTIVSSSSPDDLPRPFSGADDFRCKFCDYKRLCWNRPAKPNPALNDLPTHPNPNNLWHPKRS